MILLLLNPILWFPLSAALYAALRHYRPKMDKAEAAIIATGIVPLIILFVARRITQ